MMMATTTNLMIWRRWRSPFQKWTAGAAVLDFTVEEWKSLNRLMEANAAEMSKFAAADNNKNNTRALGMENGMIGGKYDEGEVKVIAEDKSNTFNMCLFYRITQPQHVGRPNQAQATLPMM